MYVAMNNRYVDLYNIYLININLYLYLTLYTLKLFIYIYIYIYLLTIYTISFIDNILV